MTKARYFKSRQIKAHAKPRVDHDHVGLIGTQEISRICTAEPWHKYVILSVRSKQQSFYIGLTAQTEHTMRIVTKKLSSQLLVDLLERVCC